MLGNKMTTRIRLTGNVCDCGYAEHSLDTDIQMAGLDIVGCINPQCASYVTEAELWADLQERAFDPIDTGPEILAPIPQNRV